MLLVYVVTVLLVSAICVHGSNTVVSPSPGSTVVADPSIIIQATIESGPGFGTFVCGTVETGLSNIISGVPFSYTPIAGQEGACRITVYNYDSSEPAISRFTLIIQRSSNDPLAHYNFASFLSRGNHFSIPYLGVAFPPATPSLKCHERG